ncbi:DegT/DnrJ/EryC1/StrS family aminotransferase [Bosea sp. PAMC 26642]|uniref:DegT/DnrJ/EryC1/StrS family aminotransferase n=1 Tax=Bosea sp. (strain PAMC 26642) TaxID=1792307 RepID=UPI00077062CC|nr:DegT/DnrJ/EryC1/StrS family aminotransferase [Bosea sp. PAMC 26642]AMJ62692.1 degt/dnrj/eryc1/strs aminotransferase [Bosea sp. PAMC 26642]
MQTSGPINARKIRVLIPRLPDVAAIAPHIARIDAARTYSNHGPLSREFSDGLSALTGAGGVTLTCNGTAAIEIALRARANPGAGLCLMPAFTFIASAHAVCNAGLTPHLLEVDPDTLVLTPAIAEAALTELPQAPSAVLVVSAFGAPPDLRAWAAFEDRHGIPVVFDAAAAVTALSGIGLQPVCVSLHATKVLGIGEGGAILSSDQALVERMTGMTGFGFVGQERVSTVRGGNYRLSEYAAAIGLVVLDGLPEQIERLRALTATYRQLLHNKRSRLQIGAGTDWVTMTLNAVIPPDEVEATLTRLSEADIEWRRWWGLGCHRHPAFADVPRCDLSGTDALAPCVIGLPFHDELSEEDVWRVVSCLP